ncbi:MAG TPA: tat pathway signal sequence [Pseudonocardiaceae bacterium]
MIRLTVVLAVLLCVSACGGQQADPQAHTLPVTGQPSVSAPVTSTAPPSSTAADCPFPQSGFDCDFQRRFAAVQAYIATRPGTVGIVVRDRQSGAVWRNQYADTLVWTASTIKLAMTVDLFLRDRAGTITLSATDRSLIQRMLHSSDDNAADSLWFKYSGSNHLTFNNDFPRYGMTSLQPKSGYTKFYPYWGFQKCTPDDLDRLVSYVLAQLPVNTRDYIVGQLEQVDPDQQWGVWGAGAAAHPGNKDGWSLEDTGWVMNTVGWVGPGQRYTLAVMNSLNGQGGYNEGQATDSHIAQLLFTGRTL